jgi:hypothetical protein
MSHATLLRERSVVRWRLMLDNHPNWWWLQRLDKVEEELRRRG